MRYFTLVCFLLLTSCHSLREFSRLETPATNLVENSLAPTFGRYRLIAPKSYANHVARAEKFFSAIQTDREVLSVKFIGTTHDPANILASMRASENFTSTVTTYGSFWDKWSVVIAGTTGMYIELNKYKLIRNDCEIINTLVHEYMHVIGYGHGTNSVKGNARDFSVPYWMGNKAESYCLAGRV